MPSSVRLPPILLLSLLAVQGCARAPINARPAPETSRLTIPAAPAPRVEFSSNQIGITPDSIFDWDSQESISRDTGRATSEMFIAELAEAVQEFEPTGTVTLHFDRTCSNRLFLDVLYTLGQAKSAVQVLAVRGGDGQERGFIHAPPRPARIGPGITATPPPVLKVKIRSDSVALENVKGTAASNRCWAAQDGVIMIPHHNGKVHREALYGCASEHQGGANVAIIEGSPHVVFEDIARTLSALSGAGFEAFQFRLPREGLAP